MEIERKYKVSCLPGSLAAYNMEEITQAYLCADPVIRVRKILHGAEERYVLTVKGPGMIEREEHEFPLRKDAYELLLGKKEGRTLRKKRYRIPLPGGETAELDVFEGEFEGLLLVEVEFPDRESMRAFRKPDWFGEDVSEREEYKNSRMCFEPRQSFMKK